MQSMQRANEKRASSGDEREGAEEQSMRGGWVWHNETRDGMYGRLGDSVDGEGE